MVALRHIRAMYRVPLVWVSVFVFRLMRILVYRSNTFCRTIHAKCMTNTQRECVHMLRRPMQAERKGLWPCGTRCFAGQDRVPSAMLHAAQGLEGQARHARPGAESP